MSNLILLPREANVLDLYARLKKKIDGPLVLLFDEKVKPVVYSAKPCVTWEDISTKRKEFVIDIQEQVE